MYCTNFVWHNDKAKEIAIFEFFINAIFFFCRFRARQSGWWAGRPPGPYPGDAPLELAAAALQHDEQAAEQHGPAVPSAVKPGT